MTKAWAANHPLACPAGTPPNGRCQIGSVEVVDFFRDDLRLLAEEDQPFDADSDKEPSVQPPVGPGAMSAEAMSAATHQGFVELVTTLEKGCGVAEDRRPQLQKIESPRMHVPRQQPEVPRTRHRLIFSWRTWQEWQITRQPPRNWQPLPPLPGPAESLPEDMIRVLPPVLWLLRDQDSAQEPEIEYGDENGQIQHLATVLSGEVTLLPRVGDVILSYRLVEHMQGRDLLFVVRRVSLPHVPGETPFAPIRPDNPHPDDEDDAGPDGNPGSPYVHRAPQLAALRVPATASSSFPAHQHASPSLAVPAEAKFSSDANCLAPPPQQASGCTVQDIVQDVPEDTGSWATGVYRGSNARPKEMRRGEVPRLNKTSATTTTPNVEQILKDLKEPLGVVYTVESSKVSWREAIVKELKSLQDLGVMAAHVYATTPNLTIVPGKVVWTVKPPESSAEGRLFKRNARIVACGNFETPSEKELFASGSSVEMLRVA